MTADPTILTHTIPVQTALNKMRSEPDNYDYGTLIWIAGFNTDKSVVEAARVRMGEIAEWWDRFYGWEV